MSVSIEEFKVYAKTWHGGVATRSEQDGLLICDECGRQIGETAGDCWSCDDWRNRQMFQRAIDLLEANRPNDIDYGVAAPEQTILRAGISRTESQSARVEALHRDRQRLEQAVEDFQSMLERWTKAYPEDIFPEPPAGEHGKTVDACSARMGRHVVKAIYQDFHDCVLSAAGSASEQSEQETGVPATSRHEIGQDQDNLTLDLGPVGIETILSFGIRVIQIGNQAAVWCIHCNCFIDPEVREKHKSWCPYRALELCYEHTQSLAESLVETRDSLIEAAAMLDYYLSNDENALPWGVITKATRMRYRSEVNLEQILSGLGMWDEDHQNGGEEDNDQMDE